MRGAGSRGSARVYCREEGPPPHRRFDSAWPRAVASRSAASRPLSDESVLARAGPPQARGEGGPPAHSESTRRTPSHSPRRFLHRMYRACPSSALTSAKARRSSWTSVTCQWSPRAAASGEITRRLTATSRYPVSLVLAGAALPLGPGQWTDGGGAILFFILTMQTSCGSGATQTFDQQAL